MELALEKTEIILNKTNSKKNPKKKEDLIRKKWKIPFTTLKNINSYLF